MLNELDSLEIIKNCFKENYGKEIIVKIVLNEGKKGEELKIEELFKEKGVNYTNIDWKSKINIL